MDINFFRGLSTVFVMVAFIGICWWAFSPKRKQRFTDAANLPFADEDKHQQAQQSDADSGGNVDESSENNR
jgi:cytochrome c oxidase cbb3-type subunit 4